jgi:hypothetical protein
MEQELLHGVIADNLIGFRSSISHIQAGLLFLRGIEEPRAFSARDAFRYMAGTMYSNLQNTLVAPVRLAGRWTYKLSSVRRWGKK